MSDDFSSATANFNARFDKRHSEYLDFLIKNKLFQFRTKLSIVMTRFECLEEFTAWLDYVSQNKTAKSLEGQALISYVNAALRRELGL